LRTYRKSIYGESNGHTTDDVLRPYDITGDIMKHARYVILYLKINLNCSFTSGAL